MMCAPGLLMLVKARARTPWDERGAVPALRDGSEKTRSDTYQTPRRADAAAAPTPSTSYIPKFTRLAVKGHRAVALARLLGHALAGFRQPINQLLDFI